MVGAIPADAAQIRHDEVDVVIKLLVELDDAKASEPRDAIGALMTEVEFSAIELRLVVGRHVERERNGDRADLDIAGGAVVVRGVPVEGAEVTDLDAVRSVA